MRRRIFLVTAGSALSACTFDRRPRLNVFNWDNYVAPDTIPNFERRFNCRVRYGVYASAEELLGKTMTGNSGWDVVFPSNSFVEHMRALDLLLPLEHDKLPHLSHVAAPYQHPAWDPALRWCIPYMQGATGILYAGNLHPAPEGWVDMWSTAAQRRMTMLDDPAEVFAAALKRLGVSVNAAGEQPLRAARRLALEQKSVLRAYLNEEVRDQVIAGDVLAAQMWTQVAVLSMRESANLRFVFPSEGFPTYIDCAAILRESRHMELAYAFLDYLLEPATAASISAAITGGTVNADARALLPSHLRENTVLFPDSAIAARGELFRALPADAQRLRDRYWTEIKSA